MISSLTPATLAGWRSSARKTVGRLAARHVEADAIQRGHLLAQHRAIRLGIGPGFLALFLVIDGIRSAALRSAWSRRNGNFARAACSRPARVPARPCPDVQAVEAGGVVDDRGIARAFTAARISETAFCTALS